MYRFFALAAAVALIAAACTTSPSDVPHEDETNPTSSTTTTTAAADDDAHIDEDSLDGGLANAGAADDDHIDEDPLDGGNDDDDSLAAADRTVDVLMTEFAFDVDPVDVAAGETIEFVVTNAGVVPHEFRLSNGHRIEEHLASGHDDHDDNDDASSEGGHEETGDFVLLLDAGATSSIVVTFPEDTTLFTEVACLLPGHYEAGMLADVHYTA